MWEMWIVWNLVNINRALISWKMWTVLDSEKGEWLCK